MNNSITNRNISYFQIVDKLPQKRKTIFELIKRHEPCTAWELCSQSMLPVNEVSGRITELKRLFLVVECGKKENRFTGHFNTVYRKATEEERVRLINAEFVRLRDVKDDLINGLNLGVIGVTKQIVLKELKKINKQIDCLPEL